MCNDYSDKISALPTWKLNSIVPIEFKNKDSSYKHDYLIEKFKNSNPIYIKLKHDLQLLEIRNINVQALQSLDLDPRYLESMWLKEIQIDEYYRFVDEVKSLL